MRSKKLLLAIAASFAAAGVIAGVGSAGATPRSGALHVTKECSEYTGAVGSFCTITSSNIPQIKAGMRIVYLQAFGADGLDSDIVLSREHGSAALGHVVLDATASRVTFSGGTGAFSSFTAEADVSYVGGRDWAWDGEYRFSRDD